MCIRDRAGAVRPAAERVHAEVRIENAHLWQGVKDPYPVSYTHLENEEDLDR